MPDLPTLHLHTLFLFDSSHRILSTREPQATPGPLFILIRSPLNCLFAIRADLPKDTALELTRLAREEPPLSALRAAPLHAIQYQSLLGDRTHSGPAFTFPQAIPQPADIVSIQDEHLLAHYFSGWIPGEIRAGRAPLMAVLDHGIPVSICFCARRSDLAAEAGLETAQGFRGRGFAPRVTAAWALAVGASGRIPLYSTDWSNEASLAVARKLSLTVYAVDWSISD